MRKLWNYVIIFNSLNLNPWTFWELFDGLVQERRNSIVNALELRLSCTNPSNCVYAGATNKA